MSAAPLQQAAKKFFKAHTNTPSVPRLDHLKRTVEVYLLKTCDHGRAGTVVDVERRVAHQKLLPAGQAVLMGEGRFRKVLPVLQYPAEEGAGGKLAVVKQPAFTARQVRAEVSQLLR